MRKMEKGAQLGNNEFVYDQNAEITGENGVNFED